MSDSSEAYSHDFTYLFVWDKSLILEQVSSCITGKKGAILFEVLPHQQMGKDG